MATETSSLPAFSLETLLGQGPVADLIARETVTLIESPIYRCGTGVFAYQAQDRNGVSRRYVGILMMRESATLLSLTFDGATQLLDMIRLAQSFSDDMASFIGPQSEMPALDALGRSPIHVGPKTYIAAMPVSCRNGGGITSLGIWFEDGETVTRPYEPGFKGHYTMVSLDKIEAFTDAVVCAAYNLEKIDRVPAAA